jgi:hypothetical protein
MNLPEYSIKHSYYCPKCGARNQPLALHYQYGSHGVCAIVGQHLHGWCRLCGYQGPEFAFAVKK